MIFGRMTLFFLLFCRDPLITEFILVEVGPLLTAAFVLLSCSILSKVEEGCGIDEFSLVFTIVSSGC